jgi:DNA-binding NarL/FixJ family response regulator
MAAAVTRHSSGQESDRPTEIQRSVEDLARTVLDRVDEGTVPLRVRREVFTSDACYALSARPLRLPDGMVTAVVTLERRAPEPPPAEALREAFGLTRKEASVARLLARGFSNLAIAHEMGVSKHTARHHTENVMLKLCVRSRTQVGGVLRAGLDARQSA